MYDLFEQCTNTQCVYVSMNAQNAPNHHAYYMRCAAIHEFKFQPITSIWLYKILDERTYFMFAIECIHYLMNEILDDIK